MGVQVVKSVSVTPAQEPMWDMTARCTRGSVSACCPDQKRASWGKSHFNDSGTLIFVFSVFFFLFLLQPSFSCRHRLLIRLEESWSHISHSAQHRENVRDRWQQMDIPTPLSCHIQPSAAQQRVACSVHWWRGKLAYNKRRNQLVREWSKRNVSFPVVSSFGCCWENTSLPAHNPESALLGLLFRLGCQKTAVIFQGPTSWGALKHYWDICH